MLTQILNDSQQSLYRVQCRQTLAIAVQLVRCRHSVLLNYWEETTQHRRPIAGLPLLEFSPTLESWSDIYTGPTSCLFIPQIFSAFVFYPPSLSVTRLGCSLNSSLLHIMSRHAPYSWLATSLFWYSVPTQFSNAILKTVFNCSMLHRLAITLHVYRTWANSSKRARARLNEPHWTRYRADTLVKWTGLWGSIVLKHGSDLLVWVHPKSKWIAHHNYNHNST